MKRFIAAVCLAFFTGGAQAALVTVDFSDPALEPLDGVNFFSFKQNGLGLTVGAVSSGQPGVVLNRTALGLGAASPCVGEDPALFDQLCGTQGVAVLFDQQVTVKRVVLSAFDPGLDLGSLIPFVDGVQGTVSVLPVAINDVDIEINAGAIGEALNALLLLGPSATSAFALKSIVVETIPEPATLGLLLGGLGLLAFQLRRRSRG